MRSDEYDNLLKLEQLKDKNHRVYCSFNAAIEFAKLAINSSIIVNGGACIALLAFLGSIAQSNNNNSSTIIIIFSQPLLCFSFGLAFALFCSLFAYLAQVTFTEAEYDSVKIKIGDYFKIIAICAGLISVVLFLVGCILSSVGFMAFAK